MASRTSFILKPLAAKAPRREGHSVLASRFVGQTADRQCGHSGDSILYTISNRIEFIQRIAKILMLFSAFSPHMLSWMRVSRKVVTSFWTPG